LYLKGEGGGRDESRDSLELNDGFPNIHLRAGVQVRGDFLEQPLDPADALTHLRDVRKLLELGPLQLQRCAPCVAFAISSPSSCTCAA
jgi:hypothetical protein